MQENIIVYESDTALRLEVKTDGETVWLTMEQMALLFGRERSVITKHINNVFKERELPKEGYVQILHRTSELGGRPVAVYNLDVIISVGYRVKSLQGTRFRQWATRMLKDMLLRRVEDMRRVDRLEKRVDALETDVSQIKGGMNYLVQQLSSPPPDPPRRRIGFGATDDDPPTTPYGHHSAS